MPWKSFFTSLPFWAILIAHMGQNYGYETLMTELPTFMKQILHFNIKSVSDENMNVYFLLRVLDIRMSRVQKVNSYVIKSLQPFKCRVNKVEVCTT